MNLAKNLKKSSFNAKTARCTKIVEENIQLRTAKGPHYISLNFYFIL